MKSMLCVLFATRFGGLRCAADDEAAVNDRLQPRGRMS